MKRVAVIGSPGSGKSTLARELSRRSGLPLHHMDRLFWRPGWVEPPKDEWASIQQQLVETDSWIIDGNYGGTMPIRLEAADTIIFLDLPPMLCVGRILKRSLFDRDRPDMADGCRERMWKKDYFEFLRYAARFRRDRQPSIVEKLESHRSTKTVYHLKSRSAIAAFLKELQ